MDKLKLIIDKLNYLVDVVAYIVNAIRRAFFNGCEKEKTDETKKDESKEQ